MNEWPSGASFVLNCQLDLFKSCCRQLQIFWLKIKLKIHGSNLVVRLVQISLFKQLQQLFWLEIKKKRKLLKINNLPPPAQA